MHAQVISQSEARRQVVERILVHKGPVIEFKTELTAHQRFYEHCDDPFTYYSCNRGYKGGRVDVFVKTEIDPRGQNLKVLARVMKRIYDDGSVSYYIDLEPMPYDTTEVTHRMGIVQKMHGVWDPDWTVLPTPDGFGLIIFGPPDAVFVPKKPALKLVDEKPRHPCQVLIDQGWTVVSETGTKYFLERTDQRSGKRKTTTYPKPRQKPATKGKRRK